MKVFGRDLFTKKKEAVELYDFAQHGLIRPSSNVLITWNDISLSAVSGDDEIADNYMKDVKDQNKKVTDKPKVTPKELYNLETLNHGEMQIKTDHKYLDKQIKLLEKKIKLLRSNDEEGTHTGSGKIHYSRKELQSLVERLNNRRKYSEFKEFFDEYPYTTSEIIVNTIKQYSNLDTARVEEFVPDMPEEAVETMEEYSDKVLELCGKRPVFYIIADRKDFQKQVEKRDPVLLAQSPFGLVWQILGAWDEEMILLEEL